MNIFNTQVILTFLFKGMIFFAVGVYVVFATLVVRQVYLMTQTIKLGIELPVKIIAWSHLFFAIAVFILSFFSI